MGEPVSYVTAPGCRNRNDSAIRFDHGQIEGTNTESDALVRPDCTAAGEPAHAARPGVPAHSDPSAGIIRIPKIISARVFLCRDIDHPTK